MGGGRKLLIAAVVGLVLVVGCGLAVVAGARMLGGGRDAGDTRELAATVPSEPTFASPVPEPEPEPEPEPVESTSAPATRKPTSAAPAEQRFWEQLPECAHRDKTKPVAKSKVKAALKKAAARVYWPTSAPTLRLNYPLVKAVAWMESGWQSNIHNCDGGAGIMQVMPDTVSMINGRFEQRYDAAKYQENAYLGANYLAWLTKWASERYFGDSLNLSASRCNSTTSWCLLNVVIAGYNAGQGGIEQAAASRQLPNPQYVSTVRALMTRCQCDRY